MKKSKLTPVLLLTPLLIVMAVFFSGLFSGMLQSLGYIPAFGLDNFTLDYYIEALSSPSLFASISISLYVAAVSASAATVLGVVLCFALVTLKKDRGVLYALIKIPMFIPWVVTGLLMMQLLPGILHGQGQIGVILAFVWACTPFACFMVQSVMSQVTETLGETATNLGANLWQRFWNVTLPLCGASIRNTFLILLLSCFGNYEIPVLLGMTTPRALPVEAYYQYNQADLHHRPYAMALNTIVLVLALILAGLVIMIRRRKGQGR